MSPSSCDLQYTKYIDEPRTMLILDGKSCQLIEKTFLLCIVLWYNSYFFSKFYEYKINNMRYKTLAPTPAKSATKVPRSMIQTLDNLAKGLLWNFFNHQPFFVVKRETRLVTGLTTKKNQ